MGEERGDGEGARGIAGEAVELVGADLGGDAEAVGGRLVGVDEVGLGEEDRGPILLVLGALGVRAWVGDLGGADDAAEVVDLEDDAVADAGVGGIALVVIGEGLALVDEECGVLLRATGLEEADLEIALGDGVGVGLVGAAVEGEDLDAERATTEGPDGLAALDGAEARGDHGVLEVDGDPARVLLGLVAVVLARVAARDGVAAEEDAGVEPRLGEDGRDVEGAVVDDVAGREDLVAGGVGDRLGVLGLDHAEAPELALRAVVGAVVVAVFLDEGVAGDVVEDLDPLDDVDREGQARLPGATGGAIGQVELGGGGVVDTGLEAEVVLGLDEEVGLAGGHQVDVGELGAAEVREIGGPDEGRGALAEDVDELDVAEGVDGRDAVEVDGGGEGVARLVAVEPGAVVADVKEVGGAGAVDVAGPEAVGAEAIGAIEDRRAAHGDRAAEATSSEVGPVGDVTVADAADVGEAVAGHVGEVEGLARVGPEELGAGLLVGGAREGEGRAKAVAAA